MQSFEIPFLRDEDMPIDELIANIKDIRAKAVESDGESTIDGRLETTNSRKEKPQKSSPLKIIQPTASIVEKFTQKKVNQTLKIMGGDHHTQIARQKSTRVTKPGPALQTPFRNTALIVGNTKQVTQPNTMVRHGYDPFAPVDRQKVKILDDWSHLDE